MEIKIAKLYSKEYAGALALRKQILGGKLDVETERKLTVFVAMDGKKVIGTASVQLYPFKIARIRQVAVHPDHQGQQIGNQLMESCEAFAKEHDHSRLILTARKVASLFYQKRDYHVFWFPFKKYAIDFFWMTKNLNTPQVSL